jgi:hypothetical protein
VGLARLLCGRVVLVQINNLARSPGRDTDTVRTEVQATRDRINACFDEKKKYSSTRTPRCTTRRTSWWWQEKEGKKI